MWNGDAADRYESWFASPRGSFALAREQRLMADVISPWHRRSQTLLEIGCGAGHFLQLFYGGGFDVTGIDKSEAMLEKAKARMGNKAVLRCGDAERLPFDDEEFDYVAMVTALECMDSPETALREAFRVATRGVVIAYLNAWSLYRLEQKLQFALRGGGEARRGHDPLRARWFDLPRMRRMIRNVSGKRLTVFRSTLFSPSFLWRGVRPFSLSWAHLLPFGAVSVARVDLVPVCATTIVLRPPKMAAAAQASAGVATLGRYPKYEEKQ